MIPLDVNGEYLESRIIARKSIRKLEKIIYLFESLRASKTREILRKRIKK